MHKHEIRTLHTCLYMMVWVSFPHSLLPACYKYTPRKLLTDGLRILHPIRFKSQLLLAQFASLGNSHFFAPFGRITHTYIYICIYSL